MKQIGHAEERSTCIPLKSLGTQDIISNRNMDLLAVDLPDSSAVHLQLGTLLLYLHQDPSIFPRTSFHNCLFCLFVFERIQPFDSSPPSR